MRGLPTIWLSRLSGLGLLFLALRTEGVERATYFVAVGVFLCASLIEERRRS